MNTDTKADWQAIAIRLAFLLSEALPKRTTKFMTLISRTQERWQQMADVDIDVTLLNDARLDLLLSDLLSALREVPPSAKYRDVLRLR